jgi:hypothetical protein
MGTVATTASNQPVPQLLWWQHPVACYWPGWSSHVWCKGQHLCQQCHMVWDFQQPMFLSSLVV